MARDVRQPPHGECILKTSVKIFGLTALVATFIATAAPAAHATTLTVNFCPGDASCPANVTEASLTFDADLSTSDLNDYILDLKIVGGAGSAAFIDQVSFTIDSIDNVTGAGGYEVKPTLLSAPGGVTNWSVFYDNVNNGSGCSSDSHNGKEVCAQSGIALNSGKGVSTNGTNVWEFSVNLSDELVALSVGSAVNLRAAFLNTDGGNGGILSPGGGRLIDPPSVSTVPEPASMALFGSGLLFVARTARRRIR